MTDAPPPQSLRDRCKALNDKLRIDAMLRQNSPVDTILEFVVSEIGRSADARLESSLPLCLYFQTAEDREDFVRLIRDAKPSMTMKRVGP